ncbi:hypothetical protein ACGFIU_19470 [Rhodococcus oryzae]|uniref:hypothetical protein n=1 Tax=Rhodococcus oryzae TaxID=2571143 RepID=UPI00371269E4
MEARFELQEIRVENAAAAKVGKLTGDAAERLADLAIHRADLTFAKQCIQALDALPAEPQIVRDALYRSAVVAWAKCFASSDAGRFKLKRPEIYPQGLPSDTANYFYRLRNKHIAHDDSPFSQAVPIAFIAKPGAGRKVIEVGAVSMTANIDTNGFGLSNLNQLVEDALKWVAAENNKVGEAIREDLELRDYAELMALQDVSVTPPNASDVATTRTR